MPLLFHIEVVNEGERLTERRQSNQILSENHGGDDTHSTQAEPGSGQEPEPEPEPETEPELDTEHGKPTI